MPDRNTELTMRTGTLSLEQVNLILNQLPLEVTFVDENDIVKYYSSPPDMLFTRKPGNIGITVQECHSPESRPIVNRIIDAFRGGSKDHAELRIVQDDKFIHVGYRALRDADGNYRGILETSQDITRINKLKVEQTGIDW